MKKQLLLSSVVLLFAIHSTHAQTKFSAPSGWQKTLGGTDSDVGTSVQQTRDGGYIVTGYTWSFGAGGYDAFLIKTDSIGSIQWSKTFGGTGNDYGSSVQQTSDSGYIITGITNNFGAGFQDVYLIRTDVNGNMLWSKAYGGAGTDGGNSVQQTDDGGYIITGVTNSFGAGNYDVYLIRTDVSGDMLWTKTYGGAGSEEGYSVQRTSDGGYIIAGYTSSFGAGNNDVYLIKTDSIGTTQWTKTFGGIDDDEGTSVQQTSDGGYFITGNARSFGPGFGEMYSIRTDAMGNMQWSKTFVVTGGAGSDGYSGQLTSDGGSIITGRKWPTSGFAEGYLIKIDAMGNMQWSKTFGTTGAGDVGYSVQQTSDGGYIIAGLTSSFGASSGDVYLIKTDGNGTSGCYEGVPSTNVISPVTVTNTSSPTTGSGGADTTAGTIVNNAAFVVYDVFPSTNITVTDASCIGCSDGSADLTVNGGTLPYAFFWSNGETTEDIFNLSAGTYSVTVIDISGCTTTDSVTINEMTAIKQYSSLNSQLKVYPNPSSGVFAIEVDIREIGKVRKIMVYNMLGKVMYEIESELAISNTPSQLKKNAIKIDLNPYNKGIYHLQIITEKLTLNKKIVYQ